MAAPPPRPVAERDLERPLYCLCFNLRRSARALTRRFDAALAPVGLTVSQFSVLGVVAMAAPIPMRRLADWLEMDRTTLTRALAPLVRDGLVRTVEGKDRRQRRIALTPAGKARLDAALLAWRQAQADAVAAFGSGDSADLLTRLAGLRRAVAAADRAPQP